MKTKLTGALSFLLLILISTVPAFAQIFGSDEENWSKVFIGLKKINSRLVKLETQELGSLKNQLENMLREIEEVKHALPQLQGMVEQNKSETLGGLNITNAKLNDLEAEVKNQVLSKIHQQNKILEQFRLDQGKFRLSQENLKVGLAQDIEKFEQSNKTNFHELSVANNVTLGRVVQQLEAQSAVTKKGFDDTIALFRTDVIPAMAKENQNNRGLLMDQLVKANTDTQLGLEAFSTKNQQLNKKLIEILELSLKQGLETKSMLGSIKSGIASIQKNLVGKTQNLADSDLVISKIQTAMVLTNKNLLVADEKTNKLAESLKALQANNIASNKALGVLRVNLEQAGEFDKLADEKANKLIDLTSKLADNSTKLGSRVTLQLKDSAQKEDVRTTKVDLANEKLSRLIEILKAIVKEQAKLDPVAKTLNELKKEQAALKRSQADLKKNQETIHLSLKNSQAEIKEALGDLRRKANVNISRSDDIKKTLGRSSRTRK
jgi:hypothetical protein